MERRLTAILAADVVGYSRLMGANESGTVTASMDGLSTTPTSTRCALIRGIRKSSS